LQAAIRLTLGQCAFDSLIQLIKTKNQVVLSSFQIGNEAKLQYRGVHRCKPQKWLSFEPEMFAQPSSFAVAAGNGTKLQNSIGQCNAAASAKIFSAPFLPQAGQSLTFTKKIPPPA
jgi:hypothetical protein